MSGSVLRLVLSLWEVGPGAACVKEGVHGRNTLLGRRKGSVCRTR